MRKLIWLVVALGVCAFALNKDGLKGVNKTHSAQTMGHSKFGIGFMGDIAMDMSVLGVQINDRGNPYEYGIRETNFWINGTTGARDSLIAADASITKFLGSSLYPFMSIGLGQVFDFSIALPVYYESFSNQLILGSVHPIEGLTNTGIGDLRLNAKFRAPIPEDEYVMDIALLAGGSINTHSGNGLWVREAEFLGTEACRTSGLGCSVNAFGIPQNSWKVAGLGTVDFRRLEDPVPMVFHVNAGYRAPFADYSPVTFYSGVAEVYLMDFFSIWAEIYKESPAKSPANEIDMMEISAGGAIHTDVGIELYVAVHSFMGDEGKYATNLVSLENEERKISFVGRTIPALYGMVGFSWNGYLIPQDSDKDGILDKFDKCKDEPEDDDEWEEDDGCPDIDNDKDGIADMDDKCPIDPEDKDAFMDEDGCPDPDNDGDGVIDIQDRCPVDPELVNGIEDADGCPESDKDNDGVVDGRDMCTDEPEDKDAFMDGDGCPETDNDNDGILDASDKCPNAAETKNGIDDADGCAEGDTDADGLLDDKDECPTQPEDRDGFEDKDGCPDEDNDKDGILDADDKCPVTPQGEKGIEGCPILDADKDGVSDDKDDCPKKAEDMDDFQDADGCPDTDNDFDGILDTLDKCPIEAETKNGIDDKDGCPENDTDGDGLFDDKDECPTQAEDKDSFEDKDGCPDMDNDKDGLLDSLDKCPLQPETANGFKDEDGCPDEKVKPIDDNVILDGVNFKTGTAELTFESKKVLDKIVEQLQAYPEAHIEIRGHTDNVGKRAANQKLSESRAKSVVDYFASKGVDMKRMSWAGFADTQPLEENKTAAGRAKNRRIEMYRTK